MDCVFPFAQVSQALASVHGVAADRAAAFRARLKHYQKMGFPKGINTGRGRAAQYDIGHVIQLAVVLEANQMGLTPDRARNLVTWNIDRIQTAVGLALFRQDDPLPMFITFDPNGLDDLQDSEFDRADETFHYAGIGQLIENARSWADAGVPRYAVINLSTMIDRCFEWLAKASGIPSDMLRAEAEKWSQDFDGDNS